MPAGTYEAEIDHRGHRHLTISNIQLAAAQNLKVRASLASVPLTIASVTARRPKPPPSLSTVTETSPASALGQNVTSALNTLPGVTINGANGFNEYASVAGHYPTQTGITLNGAPISEFGAPANLAPFDLDLFSSASVNSSGAAGYTGGSINLDTRDPTLDWLGSAKFSQGSYGTGSGTIFEGGTTGRFGMAFTHSVNQRGSPLDGQSYLDTSGLFYAHDAISRNIGDALKIRYPFSLNNVATFSQVYIESRSPLTCTQFTGPVPCGYGPTNVGNTRIASTSITDTATLPFADVNISLFHDVQNQTLDQSGRYVNGVAAPLLSSSSSTSSGVKLQAFYRLSLEHNISVDFTSMTQTAQSSGSAYGSYAPPPAISTNFSSFNIGIPALSSRRFHGNVTLGAQRNASTTQGSAGATLAYSLSDQDSINAAINGGNLAIPGAAFSGVSQPAAFAFDCQSHTGLGFGPSASSGRSTSIESTLGYSHVANRLSLAVSFDRQLEYDSPVSGIVDATAIPTTFFPPNYFSTANALGLAACRGGRAFAPADFYYRVAGIADRVTHNNYMLRVHAPLGRNTTMDLSYAISQARAIGSDPFVFDQNSTVRANLQLPNIPLHGGSLQLSSVIGKSGAQALLSVVYTGANNAYNLPAFLTVAAGAAIPTERGILQIGVSNLTGQYPGPFATSNGAVALPLSGGGFFPTIASPLAPRTYSFSYKFSLGPPHEENLGNSPLALEYTMYPLPKTLPTDPLQVARDSPSCGPELLGGAQSTLNVIKKYVASVEAARSSSGYPPLFPDVEKNGFHLVYRRWQNRYIIIVEPSDETAKSGFKAELPVLKPFMGCAKEYIISLTVAQQAGLYVMSHDEAKAMNWPSLIFDPIIGFYHSPDLIETHFTFNYPPIPLRAPANPFALSNSPDCSDSIKPAAIDVLEELRQYVNSVYTGGSSQSPMGLDAESYSAQAGKVLTIKDMSGSLTELEPCMMISQVTPEQLNQLGLSLSPPKRPSIANPKALQGTIVINPNALQFTPRIGFFVVRPQLHRPQKV